MSDTTFLLLVIGAIALVAIIAAVIALLGGKSRGAYDRQCRHRDDSWLWFLCFWLWFDDE